MVIHKYKWSIDGEGEYLSTEAARIIGVSRQCIGNITTGTKVRGHLVKRIKEQVYRLYQNGEFVTQENRYIDIAKRMNYSEAGIKYYFEHEKNPEYRLEKVWIDI